MGRKWKQQIQAGFSGCLVPIVTDDVEGREITMLDGVLACILSLGEMKAYLKIQREELQHLSPPKRMKEKSKR